ncbi:MAG: site-specific integrase, partial [Nitrospira sp.]
ATIGRAHPFAANAVVTFLGKLFNRGEEWDVFRGVNPAEKITMFPEPSRERFLSREELDRFLEALAGVKDPALKAVFLLLLLTGARRSEVLAMEWAHVDLTRGLWRLPKTKAHRAHLIPLPMAARAAIAAVPRIEGNPFLFVGRWNRGHLEGVRSAWEQLLNTAMLEDVRLHDLRRTLGSWLAIEGASIALIGKVLGHSQLETTAIYARLNIDPQRIALEQNADRMLNVVVVSKK